MTSSRFWRNRAAVAGLIILVLLGLAAAGAPWLAPFDPDEPYVGPRHARPGRPHWMGTDQIGRDLFSRVLYGSRISLAIGLLSALLATAVGVVVGIVAGFWGRWLDGLLMRFTDVMLTFPFMFLALAMVVLFEPGFWVLVWVLALISWPGMARIARAEVLALRQQEFIEGAIAVGVPTGRILWRHLLPNLTGPIVVFATLTVGSAILGESALSYLGLGIPGTASWGQLLRDGKEYMVLNNFWYTLFPGLFIFITVLAVNFVGDGLRDALDPRTER